MTIQHISAVTLAVKDMRLAVDFYTKIGLQLAYGGRDSSFTSLRAGEGFINLANTAREAEGWWGRVILRVEAVDSLYDQRFSTTEGNNPKLRQILWLSSQLLVPGVFYRNRSRSSRPGSDA